MALKTQTFNNFNTNTTTLSADFLVGVLANGSAEFKAPISTIGAYVKDDNNNSIKPILGDNCFINDNDSVISGGHDNCIVAGSASWVNNIAGGAGNCISAANNSTTNTIGGGYANCVIGQNAEKNTISGGCQNQISSFGGEGYTGSNTIGGGISNCVTSSAYLNGSDYNVSNTIAGGCRNKIQAYQACYNTIGGGEGNCVSNAFGAGSTIGGGIDNCINSFSAYGVTISGGICNSNSGYDCSTISGGAWNRIDDGGCTTIGGGVFNCINGRNNTIAGGYDNCIGGQDYSPSGGGYYFYLCSGTIGGGRNNQVFQENGTIGGGCNNRISGGEGHWASTVAGGEGNHIRNSNYAIIGGGGYNTIHSNHHCSSIIGGYNNNVRHSNSHVIGSNITTTASDATFVNNLVSQDSIHGNIVVAGAVKADQGAPGGDNSTTGFSFGADGDTGLFSPIDGGGAGNGQLSLFANGQEVLASSDAGVSYIRMTSQNGLSSFNVSIDNTGQLVATHI